ncbi:MAG TPA: hypothetical protein VEV17_17125, partial [Bryobacteraceae bacterium]|nr:hypothetical protein [Bryobacteraceae bacterium]
IFNASLDLLNRENDPSGTTNTAPGTGVDLNIQGSGIVEAPGGMLVASKLNTAGGSSTAAANLGGTGSVTNTPFSLFRGPDSACIGNGGNICDKSMPTKGDWMQPPTPNRPDGNTFQDPTTLPTSSTKTQPPVTNPNNVCPVPGGTLTVKNVPSNCVGGGSFLPGIYYASVSSKDNTGTGAQLVFGDKTTTFGNGSGFGNYVFAGGFTTSAGNQTITFGSGMYVFAGTTNNNPEFVVDNGTTINDQNKGNTQSTQGELLLYTSGNYNWDGSNTIATMLTAAIPNFAQLSFQYGQGGFTFKGGNNSNTSMTLYGLNPDPTTLPPSVANYHDFLFWQDRANSTVLYSPTDGSIVSSPCPGSTTNEVPGLPANINNPCKNSLNNPDSPQMNLFATPNTNLNGYLYQPRGAWLNLQGGGKIGGPLRIITGALQLGGGPTVILTGTSAPITVTETALIE